MRGVRVQGRMNPPCLRSVPEHWGASAHTRGRPGSQSRYASESDAHSRRGAVEEMGDPPGQNPTACKPWPGQVRAARTARCVRQGKRRLMRPWAPSGHRAQGLRPAA